MFKHFDLHLPTPEFKDPIVAKIIELEKLKGNKITLDVNKRLFNQLKEIFHSVESLYSARIEGNRTTISDYVQDKSAEGRKSQPITEILNIEIAMRFIDDCFRVNNDQKIDALFISNLHHLLTKNLDVSREGSKTPGVYRASNVEIKNAEFTPPINVKVPEYMDELINFINSETSTQEELLKVAIAHHRFVWIHPFDNGNGRMSRVLTYAMLKKARFDKISLLNPAAVFCINREQYFSNLAKADKGTEEGLLEWCRFVLSGLFSELTKLRRLLNGAYFRSSILKPAIAYAVSHDLISEDEAKILNLSIGSVDNLIMAKDISEILPEKTPRQITYIINKMVDNGLLQKETEIARKYLINLQHKYIMRGIIERLSIEGFTENLDSI